MFNNKSFFKKLYPNQQTKVATGCDKSTLISQGRGLGKIMDRLGNIWLLTNSLYVPDLTANLLALSSIAKNKTQIKKTTSHFEVYLHNNNKPSFFCPVTNNILETHVRLSNFHCLNTQGKEVVVNEENLPLLPSQQQLTKDIIKTFAIPTQTLEEEIQINPNTEDGSSSDNSTSMNNDNEDIYANALEYQPKRI
ncbi:hypothetical protein O181_047470 [Austropuccinia psidii MF-1]|uniref:Retrovirus-related Pol polyprotein from transposon TNT 1-94-like beta-barrel domain-containing protein n=1 Tax=Austropuccinia psidii MF-1 TaxID=1389203 RepID=A0A9Q3DVC8_9BASI|nr:hypothetical protein [Austropuccinia psidii MF-1]